MHPDPQIDVEPPVKSQKRSTVDASEKENDTPQLSHAVWEFVKHIADPLIDKVWNLHLNFGKGEPQGEQFIQGSSLWDPTAKTDKKEKVSKPQISRQIPLEMDNGGSGGGGGGKKGGSGSKKPPEDKVEIENHPSEGEEDDSSSETSLELNIDPQQLASVGLDRPLLKLRLTPRRRIIATALDGGGIPPTSGGGTVTVPLHERQNGTGSNQPIESGGGQPQPLDGEGGGTNPLFSERGRSTPQQPAGGGAPPSGGNGGGNGNGNDNGGGGRPPPTRIEEMAVMVVMMEMAVEEMIHHHHQIKGNHDTTEIRETDEYMWYKDHPDPQVNQDKIEGMVGMDKCHNCPGE